MKCWTTVFLFAGMLALAHGAPAPETFTIKLKSSGQGDSVETSTTETGKAKIEFVDGRLVESDGNTTTTAEYKETILKREGQKQVTKLQRDYVKAQHKTGDKSEDLGLDGKTVIIEKKGSKYTFTDKDGKEVTGTAAEVLTKEFSGKYNSPIEAERLMLPKGPVKVGDEWKLDLEKVVKAWDNVEVPSDIDLAKATGTGKLIKTYTKDGKLFGELQFKLDLPLKAMGKGAGQLIFARSASMTTEIASDWCIDGTSDTGTMKIKTVLRGTATVASEPGTSLSIDITEEVTLTQREPVKK